MPQPCIARPVVALALTALLLGGCTLASSGRPWDVKVLSASVADEWQTYYVDADSTDHMIVIELAFTNLRRETVSFSPESVILVYTGLDETGWTETPALHKSANSTQVIDFYEESVMYSVAPGETRKDTFVYEFPRSYVEFTLYFPESEAVPILATEVQDTAWNRLP